MATEAQAEQIERWANRARESLKRAVPMLARARKSLDVLQGMIRNGRWDNAMTEKARIQSEVFKALGVAIDHGVPEEKAEELALRTFFSSSVSHHAGVDLGRVPTGKGPPASQAALQEIKGRVEAFAAEVLSMRSTSVPSEEIVRSLAEKGWNAERFGQAWTTYLNEVFDPSGRVPLAHRREALKMFLEFKRSLEPKVVEIQGEDMDTIPTEQLEALRNRLVKDAMEGYLGGVGGS